MRQPKKIASRRSGWLRGAVAGERLPDSSASVKPPSCAERIQATRLEALRWAALLQPCEAATLWCMIELQPPDGSAFAVTLAQVSEALGVHNALGVHAVRCLRAKGLLILAKQGNAGRANQYRVPNPMPAAPMLTVLPPSEGGAA